MLQGYSSKVMSHVCSYNYRYIWYNRVQLFSGKAFSQHFDLLPECSVHLQMAFAFMADANSEFQVHAAANVSFITERGSLK